MYFEQDDALVVETAPLGGDVGEVVRELIEMNGLVRLGQVAVGSCPELKSLESRNPVQFVATIRDNKLQRRRSYEVAEDRCVKMAHASGTFRSVIVP